MSKKTMSREAQISLEDKERERKTGRADRRYRKVGKILQTMKVVLPILVFVSIALCLGAACYAGTVAWRYYTQEQHELTNKKDAE